MRERKVIRTVHLWLGLLLGVPVVLVAGSGSLLVFRHEIDQSLDPHLFRATPGSEVGFDRAYTAVERFLPGRAVAIVESPAMPRTNGVYVVRLAGEPEVAVHVDPGTGSILGWRSTDGDMMEWLFRLHTELLVGEVGTYLVGVGGILLLLMIVTGLRLWWPGRKKLALGFAIRRGRGRFLFNFDLHKIVGFAAAPLLTLIVVTGVLLTFDALADRLFYGLSLTTSESVPPKNLLPDHPTTAERLPLDELRRIAEEAMPNTTTISMRMPQRASDLVQVRSRAPASPHPNGRCFVHLDPYSGRVLWTRDERRFSPAEGIRSIWLYPLHIGRYGGGPSRVVHVLIGFIPSLLLATGLVIWRQHARSRRITAWARKVGAERGKSKAAGSSGDNRR
jgi:uncharacterized iron-regulated membrane protein